MNTIISQLVGEMIDYQAGDPKRIGHLLKVYGFASAIGKKEKVDESLQKTIEIAAVLHDVGIKLSEEKYHSSAGNYQEIEGPPVAKMMMQRHNLPEALIERVCFLIANHHTYGSIVALDYQILIEADFLVNIYEGSYNKKQIESIYKKYFKTETGRHFLETMYL
ncbi:MAG: HD domain-containing protein [Eubacterium sp.]|nr:HD domain-containing protein [Eubacterium sp.]